MIDTKFCSGCSNTKPVTEFNVSKARKDGLQGRCRTCTRREVRTHYKANTNYYTTKARKRRAGLRVLLRAKIEEYLTAHPCVDCGESDLRCLTFDHVRGKKIQNVSDMVRNTAPWEKILDEIAKCDVRCANCHMRRTATQFGWWSAKNTVL